MAKLGLQLYSVRNEMETDMEKTLHEVARMGYECVEFAGFFSKSADKVKKILDDCGLEAASVHQSFRTVLEDTENTLAFMKKIGIKYFIMPGFGSDYHAGGKYFEQTVEELKETARLLGGIGVTFGYHNHYAEFEKLDGKFILDILFERVPEMTPEIDTAWVNYAGYDPAEYIRRYNGRLKIVHLKDYLKTDDKFEFKYVGGGCVNVPAVVKSATECGAEYFIVEQDESNDISPMESARKSIEYLKNI